MGGGRVKLFHFSEESSIEIFVPRVKENRRNMPPVVWAIDDVHEHFIFPGTARELFITDIMRFLTKITLHFLE
ncbi:hypothetical protein GCM10020370_42770 [Paenibacillus hodogayensis]